MRKLIPLLLLLICSTSIAQQHGSSGSTKVAHPTGRSISAKALSGTRQAAAITSRPNGERLRVGLVLGGGGAKGAAEIGVLKYIRQAGIPIDYVVGTSIGSIVGGLYCSGVSIETMDSLFRSQQWLDLFTDRSSAHRNELYAEEDGVEYVMGFALGKKKTSETKAVNAHGLLKGDSITSLLARLSGHSKSMNFDHLPTPFRCVAVDVRTMQEVVFGRGSLPLAMRSSMAIPVVFAPVRMDSLLLVDGGALNNLPVDVAKRMGADLVIAIDLSQDPSEREEKEDKWWQKIAKSIDLGEYFNWAIRRPDNEKYKKNLKMADLVIRPDLHEYNVASFNPEAISVMIKRGEQAGKANLRNIMNIGLRAYHLPEVTKATGAAKAVK